MGTCPSSCCWNPLPAELQTAPGALQAPQEAAAAKGGHGRVLNRVLSTVAVPVSRAFPLDVSNPALSNTSSSPGSSGDAPNPTVTLPQHSQYGASGVPTPPHSRSLCGGAGQPFPFLAVSVPQPRRAGRCPRLWQGHRPGMTRPGFPGLPLCPAPAVPSPLNSLWIMAPQFTPPLLADLSLPQGPAVSRDQRPNATERVQKASAPPPGFPQSPKLSAPAESSEGREMPSSAAPAAGGPSHATAEDKSHLSHAGSSRPSGKVLTPPSRARGRLGTGAGHAAPAREHPGASFLPAPSC